MVCDPPPLELTSDDVVVVCDPIEAYAALFTPFKVRAIARLMALAAEAKAPVIVTRWARVDASGGDAVDAKGHWSNYVPTGTNYVMRDLTGAMALAAATVVPVKFTNAFAHPEVLRRTTGKRRLVVAGAWAESCVLQTAHAALEHDMCPVVVTSATAGHAFASFYALMQVVLCIGEVARVDVPL